MLRLTHRFGTLTRRAVLCVLALSFTAPVWGQSRVVSVEEHWELRLGQPDAEVSAPQTTMVISPKGDLDGVHFLFTLNHVTVPQYEAGGMQVQLWDGENFVDSATGSGGTLAQDQEVITWVQRVTLEDGALKFQVLQGASETWGNFGGDPLTLSVATNLANLNSYRPGVSIAESQVSYAENRVVSLILTKLVWIKENGDVSEMNAPIPVDTSLEE
ncbi:MAG: hypothetical protein L0228_05860 [Planctomycetes bacterium]|nr:hypothetical protein [Planctomycetota bacterium]